MNYFTGPRLTPQRGKLVVDVHTHKRGQWSSLRYCNSTPGTPTEWFGSDPQNNSRFHCYDSSRNANRGNLSVYRGRRRHFNWGVRQCQGLFRWGPLGCSSRTPEFLKLIPNGRKQKSPPAADDTVGLLATDELYSSHMPPTLDVDPAKSKASSCCVPHAAQHGIVWRAAVNPMDGFTEHRLLPQ